MKRKERREAVYFFNTHAMVKGEALERSDTPRNMSARATRRVPRPRCTKCTKSFLGFKAVRLSPREPKKCYGPTGTSIQELEHRRTKRRKEARDSPSFDPLAIATTGIKEMESRKRKHQQARGSIRTLLDQRGLRTKEEQKEEWNPHPFIQLVMERANVGSKEA
jgi:hypothetical protein